MRRRCSVVLLAWFSVLVFSARARAEDGAPSAPASGENKASPEDLLKSKGLKRVGQSYVLPDEAAMAKKFRDLNPLKRKVLDAQKKSDAAEKKVQDKKDTLLGYAQKRRELRAQESSVRDVRMHNKIVEMMNELYDREEQLTGSHNEEDDAKKTRAALTVASEQYIDVLVKLRKQYDEIDEKYDQLAADPKVQEALKGVSKDGSEFKLGPSGSFGALDRSLKKLESKVLSETISLHEGAGRDIWFASLTFNGQNPIEAAVDTGASTITLPYKTAVDAGLAPSGNAPTVRAQLADGHIVECKQVYAQTVRLGKFSVENVEVAVMPADCPGAAALLGQSFLRHFSYKIDNVKGKLTLTQIEGDKSQRRGKPAKGEPRGRRPPKEAAKKAAPTTDE